MFGLSFICEPCGKAADILHDLLTTEGLTAKRHESQMRRVKRWHNKCPGGTQCTCQHRV